ncbi:hypothetical protein QBC38DRAFT_472476 [Podospora fimiseda]|uniref:Uncharacterized protein n=1 Tax=Podospora fimiseda TaxID=252190 RepID=A0AAN7BU25_9PEZI|nr:hypothetical protein QBC38DRAFT_472476 [Podospora fimiseda]
MSRENGFISVGSARFILGIGVIIIKERDIVCDGSTYGRESMRMVFYLCWFFDKIDVCVLLGYVYMMCASKKGREEEK